MQVWAPGGLDLGVAVRILINGKFRTDFEVKVCDFYDKLTIDYEKKSPD